MEEVLKQVMTWAVLWVEMAAGVVITYGAAETMYRLIRGLMGGANGAFDRKETWRGFGLWLLIGLEFTIAADIMKTAVSPTWQDIGQLAAIAGVRTFLNYFLEQDMEKAVEKGRLERAQTT